MQLKSTSVTGEVLGFERLASLCQVPAGVLFCLLACLALFASPAFAQTQPAQAPLTDPTFVTDERVLSLLEDGNEMLSNDRPEQAYAHFETFALSYSASGPLFQGWVLAARAADRIEDLRDATLAWDGERGAPPPEMALFVRNALDIFDLEFQAGTDQADAVVAGLKRSILDSDLRIEQSSSLLLQLSMLELQLPLGETDIEAERAALVAAKDYIDQANALDPMDPTVSQMFSVIAFLSRADELRALDRPLTNDEIAQAALEPGVIQAARLPETLRLRATVTLQDLVFQQDRDEELPREYIRGLANVTAIRELGEAGINTAADTWVAASEVPVFPVEQSFQDYGAFLGRYMSCFTDEVAGLDMLARVEAIQFELSQDLSTQAGREVAQRHLETLVLLWRFATRMRLEDEAREYRNQAIELSERLALRTRPDLVDRPEVPMLRLGGLALAVLALIGLFMHSGYRRKSFRVSDDAVGAGSSSGSSGPSGTSGAYTRHGPSPVAKIAKGFRGVYVRLLLRHDFRLIGLVAVAVALVLGLALLAMFVAQWRDWPIYKSLYPFTHTHSLALIGVGLAALVGLVLGILAIGRQALEPVQVGQSVDAKLDQRGVSEAVFGASMGINGASMAGQQPLLGRQSKISARVIDAGRLVDVLPWALLAMLSLGLVGAAGAGFQTLPVPQFDPIDLPDPEICPPAELFDEQDPPPMEVQQVQPQGGAAGDGQTGLDVNDSEVPENQVAELEGQLGVGGGDDAGEPFDYHTGLPSREFRIERNDQGRDGLGRGIDIPGVLDTEPRQGVPDRFQGGS